MPKRIGDPTPPETIIPLFDYDAESILAGELEPGRYTTKAKLDETIKGGLPPSLWYGSKYLVAEVDKMKRRGEIIEVTNYATYGHKKIAFRRDPRVDEATQYKQLAERLIKGSPKSGLHGLTPESKIYYLDLVDKQTKAMKAGKSKAEINKMIKDMLRIRQQEFEEASRTEKQMAREEKRKAKGIVGSLSAINKAQGERTQSAIDSDARKLHSLVVEPDDPRVKRWFDDPGLMDIQGVDTPSRKRVKSKKRNKKRSRANPTGIISPRG